MNVQTEKKEQEKQKIMGINKEQLPSELMDDILLRLPPKSLMRFKSVSKSWQSQIEDPYFIKSHLQQATTSPVDLSFLLTWERKRNILSLVNLDTFQDITEYKFPSDISLVGSCNGLTCMVTIPDGDIFLWNLAIKDSCKIPDENYFGATYGFGFDSINDDYKVLKIVEVENICHTKVYSLKNKAWKQVADTPHCVWNKKEDGVHVSGALHWLAARTQPRKQVILGFDLRTETYHELPLPDHKNLELTNITLGVLEGCLCLTERKNSFEFDTWMTKEHSWNKIFSFSLYESWSLARPVWYRKNGDEILLQCKSNRVCWYNFVKKVVKGGLTEIPDAQFCLSSIVPVSNHQRECETRGRKRQAQEGSEQDKQQCQRKRYGLKWFMWNQKNIKNENLDWYGEF